MTLCQLIVVTSLEPWHPQPISLSRQRESTPIVRFGSDHVFGGLHLRRLLCLPGNIPSLAAFLP